jgi:ferredoxin
MGARMRTFHFHVFSGTGNSRHLVREIAARLEARGIATKIVEVTAAEIRRRRRMSEGELHVFSFPVYAMSVPRIMNRYMRSLGRVGSKTLHPRAAILTTNGRISVKWRDGHEGQALAQAERILRRLGWDVVYRDSLDYPQSIASLIPIQDEERRAAIMAQVEPRIAAAAEDLAAGRIVKRPCRPWAMLVGWPFGWLYRLLGRRAWGMLFAVDARCEGCGICAARCPAGAIKLHGRGPGRAVPGWSYACEGCERCINICPKGAIQTSLLRVVVMVALSLGIDLETLRPAAASLGFVSEAAFAVIWPILAPVSALLLAFMLLRLIDAGLVRLSRVPGLRPVLAFGWTRGKRRYPDPSEGALSDFAQRAFLSRPSASLASLRNSAR